MRYYGGAKKEIESLPLGIKMSMNDNEPQKGRKAEEKNSAIEISSPSSLLERRAHGGEADGRLLIGLDILDIDV